MSPSNSKNPIICWCSPVCPAWSARWSFWSEARSPCPASGRPRPAPSRSPFGGSLCLVVGMGIIKGAKLQHLPPPRKFERAFENTVETSPPSRKSMSRPGVAITISAPFSMSRNWERCQSLKFDTFDAQWRKVKLSLHHFQCPATGYMTNLLALRSATIDTGVLQTRRLPELFGHLLIMISSL